MTNALFPHIWYRHIALAVEKEGCGGELSQAYTLVQLWANRCVGGV